MSPFLCESSRSQTVTRQPRKTQNTRQSTGKMKLKLSRPGPKPTMVHECESLSISCVFVPFVVGSSSL